MQAQLTGRRQVGEYAMVRCASVSLARAPARLGQEWGRFNFGVWSWSMVGVWRSGAWASSLGFRVAPLRRQG